MTVSYLQAATMFVSPFSLLPIVRFFFSFLSFLFFRDGLKLKALNSPWQTASLLEVVLPDT